MTGVFNIFRNIFCDDETRVFECKELRRPLTILWKIRFDSNPGVLKVVIYRKLTCFSLPFP